jgi:probable blue pigment (indigoidine) exporter
MRTAFPTWLTGLVFAMLWSSASVATKFGLQSAEPFVLFDVRFWIAGVLILLLATLQKGRLLPTRQEWGPLLIFAILNTALYLGLFVWAMREVTAWVGIGLGIAGVGLVTWPLLEGKLATPGGLALLAGSMLSYSVGSIYYASRSWQLSRLAINGWQVLMAALLLLPITLALHHQPTQFDARFWLSIAWLVLPVSVAAVQLWLHLLKSNPVTASMWLFLCPIFGFLYASVLLHEPLTWHTAVGTLLVIGGLYIGQRNVKKESQYKPETD